MTVQLPLESTDEERLNAVAKLNGCEPERLIGQALREYLDCADARNSFLEDALAALRAYEADGLHVTLEEACQWLERWGTHPELAPPECRQVYLRI